MGLLTSNQLAEWEAYDAIDPIGTWRDDFRMAKLAALMQNLVILTHSPKGEQPKLKVPYDEMPDWTGDKAKEIEKKQSVEEMKSILLSIASTQNKKINKPRKVSPPPKKRQQ